MKILLPILWMCLARFCCGSSLLDLCVSSFDDTYYTCKLDLNITLHILEEEINLKCQGPTRLDCSQLSLLKTYTNRRITKAYVKECSLDVVACLNDEEMSPPIQDLYLDNLIEPLRNISLANFNFVNKIGFTLTDTTLPTGNLFEELPSLEELSILGGSYKLQNSTFTSEYNLIKRLTINNNSYMIETTQSSFIALENLEDLNIRNSNLQYIRNSTFEGLFALKILDLSTNNIKMIESTIFGTDSADTMQVNTININFNLVSMTLDPKAFANLSKLVFLSMKKSKISKLPEDLLDGSSNIKDLILSGNEIEILPKRLFEKLTRLERLFLDRNRIKEIPDGIFMPMMELKQLDLSHNDIKLLPGVILPANNKLQLLSLSHNSISTIEGDIDWDITEKVNKHMTRTDNVIRRKSPVNSLTSMVGLDLSYNKIRKLYGKWETDLLHLQFLDLSGNEFTNIKDFNVDFSRSIIDINLSSNQIAHAVIDISGLITSSTYKPKSSLKLNFNPVNCDCNNYGLYLRLKGAITAHEPHYILNTTCRNTTTDFRIRLEDLSPEQLVCDLTHISGQRKFLFRSAISELDIHSSYIPTQNSIDKIMRSLSMYEYISTYTIRLKLDHQPDSIYGLNINTLNLSGIGLNNITFMPTESLEILDLSNNNLTNITDEFWELNISLHLIDNFFDCECGIIRKLTMHADLIMDFNELSCTEGDRVAEINVHALCNAEAIRTSRIGGYVVAGIILSIVACKTSVHFKEIAKCISRPFRRRTSTDSVMERIERRFDAAKQFDLFISFAHQDEEFVTDTLMPRLENELHQTVCVHHRDWTVGELITDQIIISVENSRRTIIILTEHFVVSDWAYLEFRTAHNMSIQEGKPRVIIILLDENIVDDPRMDRDLKSYIVINTYLKWGDPNFWEKLQKVLPREGKKKYRHKLKYSRR